MTSGCKPGLLYMVPIQVWFREPRRILVPAVVPLHSNAVSCSEYPLVVNKRPSTHVTVQKMQTGLPGPRSSCGTGAVCILRYRIQRCRSTICQHKQLRRSGQIDGS